jgi:hypothetical protein
MKGLGTAHAPAFPVVVLPIELVAAGYEANQADTDFIGTWLPSRLTLDECQWMRDYRDAAHAVFDAHASDWRKSQGLPE